MRLLPVLLCLGTAAAANPDPKTGYGEPVVVRGQLLYLHPTDPNTLQIHQSRQFMVVSVNRVLAGALTGKRILVGVIFDAAGSGVRKVEEPYTMELDPEFWRVGAEIILRASPSDPYLPSQACFPLAISPLPDDALKSPDWQARVHWADASLEDLRPIDVYCASVGDLYRIASVSPEQPSSPRRSGQVPDRP